MNTKKARGVSYPARKMLKIYKVPPGCSDEGKEGVINGAMTEDIAISWKTDASTLFPRDCINFSFLHPSNPPMSTPVGNGVI